MSVKQSIYLHSSSFVNDVLASIFLLCLPVLSVYRSSVLLNLLGFGDDFLTL